MLISGKTMLPTLLFQLACHALSTLPLEKSQNIKAKKMEKHTAPKTLDPILQLVLLQGNACIGLKPWIFGKKNRLPGVNSILL